MADLTQIMVIPLDGPGVRSSVEIEANPGLAALIAVCQPHIAPDDPKWHDLEHVRVFWKGEYLDMFVDEEGIRKRLPVNILATIVYHNNMKVHAPERLGDDPPEIYGPAVLFMRRVWF